MEKELKVSYSASNEKTVSVGEFSITIYSPLKDKEIVGQISDMVIDQIELEGITSLTLTIKN